MSGLFSGMRRRAAGAKKPAETHIIDYPGVGEVRLVVSHRAKRITLTVKTDGTVRLAIPYSVPKQTGLDFLATKKEWINRTRAKYRSRSENILPPYSTRRHKLQLDPCEAAPDSPIKVRIADGEIVIRYPLAIGPAAGAVQNAIKKGIEEAWRIEAKEYLPGRLLHISNATGLRYRNVTIRNTVSKWGSCSARNDISLSLHLMRLPDYLINYILIHELCHTIHKNHGPGFHELLDKLTDGRHTELRRELRKYHTRW